MQTKHCSQPPTLPTHVISKLPTQVLGDVRAWDWLPFPCAIPWRDFVLSIPRDKFMQDPVDSVKQVISNVSEERLLQLQQLSIYHAADIDWTAHHSRVLENLLREAYYVPCRSFEESVCLCKFCKCIRESFVHYIRWIARSIILLSRFRSAGRQTKFWPL